MERLTQEERKRGMRWYLYTMYTRVKDEGQRRRKQHKLSRVREEGAKSLNGRLDFALNSGVKQFWVGQVISWIIPPQLLILPLCEVLHHGGNDGKHLIQRSRELRFHKGPKCQTYQLPSALGKVWENYTECDRRCSDSFPRRTAASKWTWRHLTGALFSTKPNSTRKPFREAWLINHQKLGNDNLASQ